MMAVSTTAALAWSVLLTVVGRFGLVLSRLSLGSIRSLSDALTSADPLPPRIHGPQRQRP